MNGITGFAMGMFVTIVVFLGAWVWRRQYRKKRLSQLTGYLEAASRGKETVLPRMEDEFSILEDELYKTVSELRIAREQAQQERLQQADNLADIAHQLKTPLTSMSLMTQLLSEDATKEQLEYIGRIESQLTRLSWLTGSLLTMSRLDAGAVEFIPVQLPFEELAARATEPLEQLLLERGQSILLKGKEISITCDPYWTAEAIVNLIKNCSEHTPIGGSIILEADNTPLYLQITVEDTGQGFDPAELPHLFRRFFRGRNSGKDSIGIGLALCRAIVEGQGGIIRAENRAEGGARFILRFYP